MRALFFVLLLFSFVPLAHATGNLPQTSTEAHTHYCPMHPHIHGEEGDICPICGMNLVPGTDQGSDSAPEDVVSSTSGDTIVIKPDFVQALGVKTGTASYSEFGRSIRAFGEIVSSTRNETVISMRTEGWIVDLATDAVGDTVNQGDLLFTYYSPDLMSAQSDYFIGSRVGNAEQRLRQYGMDEKAIAELNKHGRMMEATPFYAPNDGTVVTLNVRKGSFVEEGDLAISMQDFSQVWVNADVPIRDLQFLDAGQKAKVIVPETGKTYEASIDFIHPVADPQTRTGNVRLVLPHEQLEPKPGTYVEVIFKGDSQERLAVPAEAVLYGEQGAIIIESLGKGQFRPVLVETGITADGFTEIVSGLEKDREIVTSGQFLIDAESNLHSGMSSMSVDKAVTETGNGHVH